MVWWHLMRTVTAEYDEDESEPEDDEPLRCDECGREVAGKVLSTAGVSPTSTTCNRCSRPAYFGSNGHAAGL